MKKLKKYAASVVSGVLLTALVFANGAVSMATPPPPEQPAPTECTDCASIQSDLDAAYTTLDGLVADVASYDLEGLLDDTTTAVYGGDTAMMVDMLTSKVEMSNLASGPICEDSANSFAYYSSFVYDGTTYCVIDDAMWFGADNFFETMMLITEVPDPGLAGNWAQVQIELIELLMDYDGDSTDGISEVLDFISSLLDALLGCEDDNCPPEPECPDCEAIAAELDTAINDLLDAELEADALDAELSALEDDIQEVFDQMDQLEQLREEFRQMVQDAGGMTDEDCDGFQVQSGQAWGIAHTFGDVQWCFTSESQIEDFIQNLDEYWETHSSQHLPTEEELNTQLDNLMNDYTDKLDEYFDVLDEIDDLNTLIEDLSAELDDCLTELAALQAQGYCLDQEIGPMEDLLDDADEALGYEPPEEPAGEEPPAEGEGEGGLSDILGHWAEEFINSLAGGDIVSGDDDTGDFRPDDPIKRSEAAKIVSLAMGDAADTCDDSYFSDVFASDWFCPFVTNAKDQGYFEGYGDGTFGPGKAILRAEAAVVVLRALGFEIPTYATYSFPDITGDEWYSDYAEKAYLCGIFEGRTVDGVKIFAGGASITRAEFSKIIDVTIFGDLLDELTCDEGDIAEPECPDCDAIWDEVMAIDAELTTLDEEFNTLMDQVQALEDLQDAFRQMVADAGGMTDAACDGFEVQSGQAWGVANAFGGVEFCLTSESQIQSLITSMGEYWENHSSEHLPSEATLNAQIDTNVQAYNDKLAEFEAKLAEYEECLDELEALQEDGYCLEEE